MKIDLPERHPLLIKGIKMNCQGCSTFSVKYTCTALLSFALLHLTPLLIVIPSSVEEEVNSVQEHGTFIYQNLVIGLATYSSQLVRTATKEALMR